jgi:hypothetical protein
MDSGTTAADSQMKRKACPEGCQVEPVETLLKRLMSGSLNPKRTGTSMLSAHLPIPQLNINGQNVLDKPLFHLNS